MHRYIILKDDRTTENGIVLEGDESCTNHGRALAFEGALIDCPACKSEGRIVNVPPYRPFTLMNGRQVALDNDICLCKCKPPPRLMASRTDMMMKFETHELAAMGYAANGERLPHADPLAEFDRHFRFVDENGQPVSGIRIHLTDADGRAREVTTDGNGLTPVLSGDDGQKIGASLFGASQ